MKCSITLNMSLSELVDICSIIKFLLPGSEVISFLQVTTQSSRSLVRVEGWSPFIQYNSLFQFYPQYSLRHLKSFTWSTNFIPTGRGQSTVFWQSTMASDLEMLRTQLQTITVCTGGHSPLKQTELHHQQKGRDALLNHQTLTPMTLSFKNTNLLRTKQCEHE